MCSKITYVVLLLISQTVFSEGHWSTKAALPSASLLEKEARKHKAVSH